MNLIFFVVGIFITFLAGGLSFYPFFEDFDASDSVIPSYKFDDYTNNQDLLVMNVYQTCKYTDNIFSSHTLNGDPICTVAENLVFYLVFMIIIGMILMIGASFFPSKEKTPFKQS
jgi:hypothetical protein